MDDQLRLASYADDEQYWSGGDYELNLSYGTLRDRQWPRLIQNLWACDALEGPFAARYTPGTTPEPTGQQVPAPTATQTQHAALQVAGLTVGCRVLATRSLFECVSLQVPVSMFADVAPVDDKAALHIDALDRVFRDIALTLFSAAPFQIATLGLQSECRLLSELQADTQQRLDMVGRGNFFATDEVLAQLSLDPQHYPAVRPALRWVPPGR
jgi:hypothetical protein